jgi:hypothetical protein
MLQMSTVADSFDDPHAAASKAAEKASKCFVKNKSKREQLAALTPNEPERHARREQATCTRR